MLFKCKMCGGELELGASGIAVCSYCRTQQTVPKIDDERRIGLYNRANHYRRNNEFDKAFSLYERILEDDRSDAEAYWSIVLCRYGIEYVEDTRTKRRIPTVNRMQFASILTDSDYLEAIKNADAEQKKIYEAEATAIDKIQAGILEVSRKEEPFDVFICYKESDDLGERTEDSVIAEDLYERLTAVGLKVFFSRITLEDKLGVAYEPYIFAALNTAKLMVVIGTKVEYFNAVWVKNEWSRYLAMIEDGAKEKVLVPAYKYIDPYDMPEEFAHLQAQDLSKLGYMQDLVRGIRKIVDKEKETTVVHEVVREEVVRSESLGASPNVASLLERAKMFLEDGNFADADQYAEKVLDIDPKNAEAYIVKLLSYNKVKEPDGLVSNLIPAYNDVNYRKALRFGNEEQKKMLEELATLIKDNIRRKDEEEAKAEEARRIKREAQMSRDLYYKCLGGKSGYVETVTVPEDVTELPDGAFSGAGVGEVILHNGITKIGKNAFMQSSIKRIVIPDSVTSIGDSAFQDCPYLFSITLGKGLVSIGRSSFYSTKRLVEIINYSSLPIKDKHYFDGSFIAQNVIEVHRGESRVSFVGTLAFYSAENGDNYVIGDLRGIASVDILSLPALFKGKPYKIHAHAFSGYHMMRNVVLNNVTEIGDEAFAYCYSLKDFFIPASVQYVGKHAFYASEGIKTIFCEADKSQAAGWHQEWTRRKFETLFGAKHSVKWKSKR